MLIVPLLGILFSGQVSAVAPEKVEELTIGMCHFRFDSTPNGWLNIQKDSSRPSANYHVDMQRKSNSFDTNISFKCLSSSNEKRVSDFSSASYSQGVWSPKYTSSSRPLAGEDAQFIILHAKNSTGAADIRNDISGPEEWRTRNLGYCLIHEQVALCGTASPLMYVDQPKKSLQKDIVQLLESIEFVDGHD
jgi:hypothetical protein